MQASGSRGLTPPRGSVAKVLREAEAVLDMQTSRGLIVVSALLNIAGRMADPELLAALGSCEGGGGDGGGLSAAAAVEQLRALHADLKQHTDSVLDAMWHIRNLPKAWQHLR